MEGRGFEQTRGGQKLFWNRYPNETQVQRFTGQIAEGVIPFLPGVFSIGQIDARGGNKVFAVKDGIRSAAAFDETQRWASEVRILQKIIRESVAVGTFHRLLPSQDFRDVATAREARTAFITIYRQCSVEDCEVQFLRCLFGGVTSVAVNLALGFYRHHGAR